MRTRWHRTTRPTEESGAALVEFALIFPIFMTIVLGMFSGGQAYNRKLTLTAAARETSRYGATLPVSPACDGTAATGLLDKWLNCVAKVAAQTSVEELKASAPERSICVSYVNGTSSSTGADDQTKHLTFTTTDSGTPATGPCPGAPAASTSQRQVHVVLQRRSNVEALFFKVPVTVKGISVSRFER